MQNLLIVSVVLLWVIVLLNLLLTLALIRRINKLPTSLFQSTEILEVGAMAPDFRLETLAGQTVSQDDYADNSKAMVFIGPDCPICKEHMPKLQDLYPKARKSGVELMIISLANLEETRAFAKEHQFSAPIYAAPKETNPLHKDYKVVGTPQYYLIDKQGKIQAASFFGDQWEQLTQKWEEQEPT